ncbi:MAG: dCMP deaminase family protein [Propionibacteriaceae bacterium]|uniref:dCMP deaminase n=2 Tax=Propionibacterium ruminifibrarum TaxID=1962131 RepID=A0A375I3Y2_9ACTN|nr:dCMP deaminase family protein [Propionibacterium ruminifibrarum]MBE6477525.1 dCMP deaminase family protein [Propionibacteriaceae bacterium]SPF68836.1 dCMP deaminase [Propionibacterium ruminifibrarum]
MAMMQPGQRITVPGWDEYFLGIAQAVSARAKCTRRRVGAVLVGPDHRIIATGYNGAAPGRPDCLEGACPRGRLGYGEVPGLGDYDRPGTPGFCIAIHAEVNALLFSTRDTKGATIYVTDEPCPGCRKALAAAGIVRAVWPDGSMAGDEIVDFGAGGGQ